MNTRLLMVASAIFMGLAGVTFTFLPQEILTNLGNEPSRILPLFLQLKGSLYLGFSIMNWMAKSILIGGIYARPLAMGNFMYFFAGAFAISKFVGVPSETPFLWGAAVIYFLFAISFGLVLFRHPVKAN